MSSTYTPATVRESYLGQKVEVLLRSGVTVLRVLREDPVTRTFYVMHNSEPTYVRHREYNRFSQLASPSKKKTTATVAQNEKGPLLHVHTPRAFQAIQFNDVDALVDYALAIADAVSEYTDGRFQD